MNRLAVSGLGMLAVAFLAVGCCDPEKQQIAGLTKDRNDLSAKVQGLTGEMNTMKDREASLMGQLTQKDSELMATKTELADAKAKIGKGPGPGPGPGPVPGKGEHEVFRGTLEGDVLFASGHADLTVKGKAELDKIVADVKKSAGAGTVIRVLGHTDNDPIVKTKNLWQDNLDLSANRAMAVTRHLIAVGISPKSIETIAMGEYHPVDPAKTADAKKKNRRVDIVVVSKG